MVVDGEPLEFAEGDSVAVAVVRHGQHPAHGGTLCLAGDCGNCVAEVDGHAWVRTCLTPATPGLVVRRHPNGSHPTTTSTPPDVKVAVRHRYVDLVVVGASDHGTAEHGHAISAKRQVMLLDDHTGDEVIAVYPGPLVVARRDGAMEHVHAHEVVIATGAAELQPVVPGNKLKGILTPKAAAQLRAAGVQLDDSAEINLDELVRIEGDDDGWVTAIVRRTAEGGEQRIACTTAIVGSRRRAPRDLLARMQADPAVRTVGPAAEAHELPPAPVDGVVCPCSGTTVEDLHGAWDRGFTDIELLKRSTLCGTGTCQGGACMPHLRAFVAHQSGTTPQPFTGRPAARQLTMGEAAANVFVDAFRRTPLHEEHLALGATMDRFGTWWRPWNYGDHVAEYWAVREGVSIGDVSTLGKIVVSGPDAVEALERLYPTTIADIKPGRSRYVLLLNERGHIIDDGMVCRDSETRFTLTFTSGGAANAEMWMRDWIESWGLNVHILDRTMALAAINVTGPLAGELLQRLGVADPPKFLQHRHGVVAGVPCHIMRLSFTGEASFELHHPVDRSVALWRALMEAGRPMGIRPHGLQALFGLRLEKGHIIVGFDTDMDTTPSRVHMDWAVKMDKPYFLGKAAIERTSKLPNRRTLVGLTVDGPAPIEGTPLIANDEVVGLVTTTFASPLLGKSVMLGWFRYGTPEGDLTADGRPVTIENTPFYDKEGARARL